MPSDRTRTSDDLRQRYKAVVMQQGRVILDRDFNALREIVDRRIAADALDEIGSCGTPDDGFAISLPKIGPSASVAWSYSAPNPWDFLIAPGTMYVGGQRVVLSPPGPGQPPWSYFNQPDWIRPDDPAAFSGSYSTPPREYVYLRVFEQEVGAVEDPDLLDVALGGPDTTQRIRLMWRVERMPVDATDCATALAQAWSARGFLFAATTMALRPQVALQVVSFAATPTTSNPCDPVAQGGYLGADNQLIRLQIGESTNGQARLLWGYDDASFLYRIASVGSDGQTLQLRQVPVDAFHYPKPRQIVEVLRTAAILGTEPDATDPTGQRTIVRCIAEATGQVATVTTYSNVDNTVTLDSLLPKDYGNDPNRPLFLRIWQGRQTIDLSSAQPISLTDPTGQTSPGIKVTITVPSGGPKGAALPVGAFWMIAARPSTPQAVYPERYLTSPQPPDGPRQWVCPLATIAWGGGDPASVPPSSGPAGTVIRGPDCSPHFEDLVTLTARNNPDLTLVAGVFSRGVSGGGLVLNDGDTLAGGDLSRGLLVLLKRTIDPASATVATCSVTLDLPEAFGGQIVGFRPFLPTAHVSASEPKILNWDPVPVTQSFLASGLPQGIATAGLVPFASDWDLISSPTAVVTWQYVQGEAEANVLSAASATSPNAFGGSLAIAKSPVLPGATTLTASVSPPSVRSGSGNCVGIVFNYSNSNDFWLLSVYAYADWSYGAGWMGNYIWASVAHYVNGLVAQTASSDRSGPVDANVARVEFRITPSSAPRSALSFAAVATFADNSRQATLAVSLPSAPQSLAAGSRVGLFTNWPIKSDFSVLKIANASREPQFFLPPTEAGRLLARLTVRCSLLWPPSSGAGAGSHAPAGPPFSSLPDFTRWFWVVPSPGGYGYFIGGAGLGATLI